MWKDDIIEQAQAALAHETGLEMAVLQREFALKNNVRVDAVVNIGNKNNKLYAEVKKWAVQNEKAAINQLLAMGPKDRVILIADYVNPRMAERLKAMELQFIDTAGNAYINQKPVYVCVTGKKPEALVGANEPKMKTGRAFQQTGLKVIYLFLREEELLNAPYRDIAKKANVALGNIGWIIGDLINQGYIREDIKTNKRVFENPEKLINKWAEEYPLKLKPKMKFGDFTTDDEALWKEFDPGEFNGLWGGEKAAEKYTHYLTPKEFTIYATKENLKDIARHGRLRKLKAGENAGLKIELIETFWDETAAGLGDGYTDPILTYADLMATGDPRNIETARRLYEGFID